VQTLQDFGYVFVEDARTAFDDNRISPALDFEESRIVGGIRVTADAEFEAVLLALHTLAAELKIV
jgi:hypothetical protein